MPDDQISSEAALIFKGCLFNSENSGIEEMIGHINHIKDWKRFMHLSLDTYLAPVLYKKLNISDLSAYIPPEVMRFLKNSYYKVLADNTRIYNEYNEISRLLSEANIEFIPLKGIFLAEELYKDIGLRHLSDIDILFKEGDINYIRELFLNKNWRLNQPKKSAHYHNLITHHPFSLVNRTLNLEVHTHIHNQLREFQVNIKDYWSRAVKTNESTLKCNLNPTDLLQHLCLHLYVHLSNGHAKVISLYDIALLVNSSEFNINWDLLKKTNSLYNCKEEVQTILYLCERVFPVNIPGRMMKKSDSYFLTEEIFFNLLEGNNKEIKKRVGNINIKDLKKVTGTGNKLRFLMADLFPSVSFMIKRYKVKNSMQLIYYYPYRLITGFYKLCIYLIKKKGFFS